MAAEKNWVEIQCVERDICYLFHQLSEYSYVMGDLYWDSIYSLPYWDYLEPEVVDPKRARFIQVGCLVMVLARAFGLLDRGGRHKEPWVEESRRRIAAMKAADDDSAKLASITLRALELASAGSSSDEELEAQSRWVHTTFVCGYFERMA